MKIEILNNTAHRITENWIYPRESEIFKVLIELTQATDIPHRQTATSQS